MRSFISLITFVLLSQSLFGQEEAVKGTIATKDTSTLSIIAVYPDSFPNVSVVFRAEKANGEPIWGLTKDNMIAKENGEICELVSLSPISQSKSLNLGVVIDHSGSMSYDPSQLLDSDSNFLYSYNAEGKPIFPKGYVAPIENAKSAIKSFIETFNIRKDYISLVGFATTIDLIIPLTKDTAKLNRAIDSCMATSSTALYDAMIAGINQVKLGEGVNVLIALTDGKDNASKSTWQDVVDSANNHKIPIYIVGLGGVNKDTLSLIASETNGKLFLTKSSNSLESIYNEISKQVQAYYDLIYVSENLSLADSTRQIELYFDLANGLKADGSLAYSPPQEVIEYLAQKKTEKQLYLWGAIFLLVVVSGGVLLFYRRKK